MIFRNILVTALKSPNLLVRHLASCSIISSNTTNKINQLAKLQFQSLRSLHLSQNVGKMLVTSSMVPPPEPTSENDVRERVLKAIKAWDRFPQDRAEKLTLDARLAEDLSFDSLDMVEIVMSFEDEFGIEIKLEDAETFKTPNDAANFIINFIGISDTEEI